MSGASHGATTATRFAVHQRVDRVVAFCGPRDQLENWQSFPSATPANRIFGFSHVLDDGWKNDHYCRSWQMLGLHRYGPIIDVDASAPPYGNSRRLTTQFEVKGDAKRAHSSVTPGNSAGKNIAGHYLHEDVWRYLFTHPSDVVGEAVLGDHPHRVEGVRRVDGIELEGSRRLSGGECRHMHGDGVPFDQSTRGDHLAYVEPADCAGPLLLEFAAQSTERNVGHPGHGRQDYRAAQ
jgi:hypothetical protein